MTFQFCLLQAWIDSTVNSVTLLLRLLGFDYAKHKLKEFSKSAAALGVELGLERKWLTKESWYVNKPGRVEEVLDSIDAVLESGSTTTREASRILGRLQYVDSFIMWTRWAFGDVWVAKTIFVLMGRRLALPPEACSSLALLRQRLLCGEPRRVPWRHDPDPPLVFTDGASEGDLHTIGGVIISSAGVQYFGCHVPDQLVRLWLESSKHIIGMVEMYGALVARTVWASILAGRKSILFVDNNAAKEAFVKGTSYNKHYRQMLVSLERLESKSRSWTWVAQGAVHIPIQQMSRPGASIQVLFQRWMQPKFLAPALSRTASWMFTALIDFLFNVLVYFNDVWLASYLLKVSFIYMVMVFFLWYQLEASLFFALLGTRLGGRKKENMSFSLSMLIPRCCVVEVGRFVQLTWIYTWWCSNGCSKQAWTLISKGYFVNSVICPP